MKRRKQKENRIFKCEIENCDKEFVKQSKLKRHLLTHQKNRQKFICDRDDCKKAYLTKYDLVAHQVYVPFLYLCIYLSLRNENTTNFHLF